MDRNIIESIEGFIKNKDGVSINYLIADFLEFNFKSFHRTPGQLEKKHLFKIGSMDNTSIFLDDRLFVNNYRIYDVNDKNEFIDLLDHLTEFQLNKLADYL